jgi:DNA-binding response OmpR family regulator
METQEEDVVLMCGVLRLLPEKRRLEGPRGVLILTDAHFRVMHRLMRRPGVVITRSDLIGELYPDPDDEGVSPDVALRIVVMKLRRWMEAIGCFPNVVSIMNHIEVGYSMEVRS